MAWKKGNEEKHLEQIVRSPLFKVGVKSLKEVESATVVYVGRGEETLLGVVHTLPINKVHIQTE